MKHCQKQMTRAAAAAAAAATTTNITATNNCNCINHMRIKHVYLSLATPRTKAQYFLQRPSPPPSPPQAADRFSPPAPPHGRSNSGRTARKWPSGPSL